eukprot:1162083-Pelagomonas_calceolata.AAC.17
MGRAYASMLPDGPDKSVRKGSIPIAKGKVTEDKGDTVVFKTLKGRERKLERMAIECQYFLSNKAKQSKLCQGAVINQFEVEHKKDELAVDPGRSERSMDEEEFRKATEQWQRVMPSDNHDAGGNPRPNRATAKDKHAPNY